jgi:hypothetical protein
MISDNIPQPVDDDLVGPYFLWKLLIDAPFQHRRYGAETLDAIVEYLRTRPDTDVLYTSSRDGPGSPRGFDLRYGFADTGESCGAKTSSRSPSQPAHRRAQVNDVNAKPANTMGADWEQHSAPNSVELPATALNCC